MSESNLYKNLKRNWKSYLRRMEPTSVGEGFPDCHLVNQNKRDILLELKFLPKRFVNKKLPIRNSQFIWFLDYKGKAAFILFQVEKEFFVFKRERVIKLKDKIKFDDFCNLSILRTSKMKDVVEMLNIIK